MRGLAFAFVRLEDVLPVFVSVIGDSDVTFVFFALDRLAGGPKWHARRSEMRPIAHGEVSPPSRMWSRRIGRVRRDRYEIYQTKRDRSARLWARRPSRLRRYCGNFAWQVFGPSRRRARTIQLSGSAQQLLICRNWTSSVGAVYSIAGVEKQSCYIARPWGSWKVYAAPPTKDPKT